MKLRYAKSLGIGCIVIGILFSCLSLTVMGSRYGVIVAVSGFFMIYFGVEYLRKPYFFVSENKIEVYHPNGTPLFTYDFRSLREIEIESGKLFLRENGKRRKIPVTSWMVDRQDWQKLVQKIGNAS